MNIRQFLFSFKGRISRSDFWLLMLTIVAMIPFAIIAGKPFAIQPIGTLIGIVLVVAALVILSTALVRRLHDRDKSAWFLLLFFLVPSALQAMRKDVGEFRLYLFSGGFNSFIDIVCLAISIWMIVELGCLRGSAGMNQYGPDPLDSAATPVDAA